MTGWVGWAVFAGVMLTMMGFFHAISGFIALFNSTFYAVEKTGLAVTVSYTAWGWIHLALGLLMIGAAYSVLRGHMFGRVVGVVVAMASFVGSILFLPAYPVWGVVMITVDLLVIFALTAHGGELKTPTT